MVVVAVVGERKVTKRRGDVGTVWVKQTMTIQFKEAMSACLSLVSRSVFSLLSTSKAQEKEKTKCLCAAPPR